MQFHQFARFDPALPRLSEQQYARLLKRLFRIPVWSASKRGTAVIPGYRNLFEFSRDHEGALKATLGRWLPTYLRLGNWRMAMPFPRAGQALAARRLTAALDAHRLQAVYLARNLRMNHCVTLYDYERKKNGDTEFRLYDPNYSGEPAWLLYHAAARTFELQKRFYFNEGRVNVMRVYISPVH